MALFLRITRLSPFWLNAPSGHNAPFRPIPKNSCLRSNTRGVSPNYERPLIGPPSLVRSCFFIPLGSVSTSSPRLDPSFPGDADVLHFDVAP
jgi:hypothetical protein